MKHTCLILIASCWLTAGDAVAQKFKTDVAPLVRASCIRCHDADTETRLDFERLGYDLSDPDTFRKWEQVFDRVHDDEMLPKSEARPAAIEASDQGGRTQLLSPSCRPVSRPA